MYETDDGRGSQVSGVSNQTLTGTETAHCMYFDNLFHIFNLYCSALIKSKQEIRKINNNK